MRKNYIFRVGIVLVVGCLISGGSQLHGAFEELDGCSARAQGMGGVFTGIADEPATVFLNPAGIINLSGPGLGLNYTKLYPELTHENISENFVSLAIPEAYAVGGFGLGYMLLDSRKYAEQAAEISYAFPLKKVNLGLGFKWLKWAGEGEENLSQELTSLDLGFLYKANEQMTIGVVLKDLWQPSGKANGVLVPRGQLGAAYTNQDFVFSADFGTDEQMKEFDFAVGVEQWLFKHRLAVRGGANTRNIVQGTNLSVGASILQGKRASLRLDYAFIYPLGGIRNTQGTHRVSFMAAAAPVREKKEKPEKAKAPLKVELSVSPQQFSPNEDGKKDKVTFTVTLGGEGKPVKWRCLVTDESRAQVKTLAGKGKPPAELLWDGKNDKGEVVAEGKYQVKIEVEPKGLWFIKKGETTASRQREVTVDLTPPVVSVSVDTDTFVADGINTVSFTSTASDDVSIANWKLEIFAADKDLVKSFVGMNIPPTDISWEGKDMDGNLLSEGEYTYSLTVGDTADNMAVSEVGTLTIVPAGEEELVPPAPGE